MPRKTKLTVGALRKAMAGLADEVPVVIDNESHEYQPAGKAFATTALLNDDHWSVDDCTDDGPLGEKTEYGTRIEVLRINDL